MESPQTRIGWLRMLKDVYGRHPGDLYRDILLDIDRLIAAAEAERDGVAPPAAAPAASPPSARSATGGG